MIKQRKKEYKRIRDLKKSGKFNYIPFDNLPNLSKYVPGIIPGTPYIIMAGTGVGKSQITRALFIKHPFDFIKRNPESGLKIKIFLNALEETYEDIIDILVCARLYEIYGLMLSVNDLNGYGKILTDEELQLIDNESNYFEDLGKILTIVDIPNIFGFYKIIRNYARNNGKFYFKDEETGEILREIDPINKTTTSIGEQKFDVWNHYVPNDPDEVVITISDHIGLYDNEKGKERYETLRDISSKYSRRIICKKFGYVSILVQQSNADAISKQFTNKGSLVIEKNEPSLDHLSEMKLTKNDALVILAVFNPFTFSTEGEYLGYDLARMSEYMRILFILKNRKGGGIGRKQPLFFNGLANQFKELPRAPIEDDFNLNQEFKDKMNKVYKLIEKLEKN